MRRFRVTEDSMLPTLRPGDEIVATDSRPARTGDLVVFLHPHREDFWMVKRVVPPPEPIDDEEAWVASDNPDATLADSRTLGPLPAESLMPVVTRLDTNTFAEACQLLAAEDPALAAAMERHGMPQYWRRQPGLPTLVWLILEQQVSLASGLATYRRLGEAAAGVTPEGIAKLGVNGMRAIGVTRQKAGYLAELAEKVLAGEADLNSLDGLPYSEARERLLALRGVGPWTADTYLLAAHGHPDVFPVGDRALQVGAAEVLGITSVSDPEELEILGEPWRPVRAAAARIIWHAYLAARGKAEPVDPVHGTPGTA
jgi:DNA-3-methyladenine glycosylase II